VGQVNLCGLRVPVFEGWVWESALLCVKSGLNLLQVDKFFVQVTECRAKAHELNQLKNCKTRGCTELVCQHCAYDSWHAAVI